MRHRVYGKHLGRDKNQRTALFKGLVRSLFLHESIITTEAKAKAIKGLADRLVSRGKVKSNSSKNYILSMIPDDEVRQKLAQEISPRYQTRVSGFTQMVKLGTRAGDGAMMVRMSLIEGDKEEVKPKAGVRKATKETKIDSNGN